MTFRAGEGSEGAGAEPIRTNVDNVPPPPTCAHLVRHIRTNVDNVALRRTSATLVRLGHPRSVPATAGGQATTSTVLDATPTYPNDPAAGTAHPAPTSTIAGRS